MLNICATAFSMIIWLLPCHAFPQGSWQKWKEVHVWQVTAQDSEIRMLLFFFIYFVLLMKSMPRSSASTGEGRIDSCGVHCILGTCCCRKLKIVKVTEIQLLAFFCKVLHRPKNLRKFSENLVLYLEKGHAFLFLLLVKDPRCWHALISWKEIKCESDDGVGSSGQYNSSKSSSMDYNKCQVYYQ